MPRTRRSAEEARRVILEAAQKRLAEGGPEAVRLQDVARDVGVSHPAILHHFGSRDGLLEALESHAMGRLQEDLLGIESSAQALERIATTLGDEGHARLLAWWTLRSTGSAAEDEDPERMLAALGNALAEERPELPREEIDFAIRLTAAAMSGEALLGPMLSSSAGQPHEAATRRFQQRLAALVESLLGPRGEG